MNKEEILERKLAERGIRKGWVKESKQAVFDAMEEYAKLKHTQSKNDDIKREVLNDFLEHYKRSFGGGLNSQIIEVMIEEFLEKNENK